MKHVEYQIPLTMATHSAENPGAHNKMTTKVMVKIYFQTKHRYLFPFFQEESPYFRVELSIVCGRELIAMDRGGSSDPYVRILQGEEMLHKTVEKKKTINPVWNDQSNIYVENPLSPLIFQVRLSAIFRFCSQYSSLSERFLTKTWLAVMISWARLSLI